MAFTLNESGKPLYLAASFDMSSNTELTMTFTKPDGTVVTKIKPDVVLETSPTTLPDVGAVLANEYVSYTVEPLFLDQAGAWCVYLTYDNTTPTPDDSFIGTVFNFTVAATPCG